MNLILKYLLLIFFFMISCSKNKSANSNGESPLVVDDPLLNYGICSNGDINAIALSSSNDRMYLGGDFTKIGKCTGSGALIDSSTGSLTFPLMSSRYPVNDFIFTSIPDGHGGFYIGGLFSKVGSEERDGIAQIDRNGILTAFNLNSNGIIVTLALSSDNNILYLGGTFTTIGGVVRNHIAALDVNTGSLIANFDPNANNNVAVILLNSNNDTLYLGGIFTTIGETPRNRVAAVNTNNGSLINTFDPDANNAVSALALSSDNNTLYLGGSFTTIEGITRNRIAAVDANNGSLILPFNPNVNSFVNALALSSDNNTLYLGGNFTMIGGTTTRNRIAAVNSSGSLIDAFNPNVDDEVTTLALNSDDSTLYLGGFFGNVDGIARIYIAAVDDQGELIDDFNPYVSGYYVQTLALSPDNSSLYLGGEITFIGGSARNRMAAIDNLGNLINDFNPNVNDTVYDLALSSDDNTLYLGGTFTTVSETTRNRIAAVDSSGILIDDFNPNANNYILTLALSSDDSTLYLGGNFTTVSAIARNRIAAVDSSGILINDFNPNANNVVRALALSSDDNTLYLGGDFTTITTIARNRIAAVDSSGILINDFNPNANNRVRTLALSSDDSTLYLAGWFSSVSETTRNKIAAVDSSGNLINDFDPNANNIYTSINEIALNSDDSILYLGGAFIISAVDSSGNQLNNFEDIFLSGGSGGLCNLILSADGRTLYAVGEFGATNGILNTGFVTINAENGSLP